MRGVLLNKKIELVKFVKGGFKMMKRDGHKGFHHHSNLSSSKQPPAISICNQPRIYTFLRERIKGQDTSLNGLASILSRLLTPHTERKVYKAVLGGAIGTGKKTAIGVVRHLLGMDPGYPYADQFIYLNGSDVSDNNAKAGGKEGVSLLKRLKNASETGKSPETGKKETLPYMCLYIDNIDKASSRFIDCVGPLFETGCYRMNNSNNSNESFSIPKKTPLLVLFTTNCASTGIANMKKQDDSVAAEMIRLSLRERWPDGNIMKRMEPILPFYILNIETLRPILMTKFEEYVKDSDMSSRFGKDKMQYSNEVKTMMVDHVLVKVNTTHGIQVSIGQLIQKLNIFFSTALGALDTFLLDTGADQQHLLSPIVVTTHSIDTNRFRESLNQQLENVVKELRQQSVIPTERTLSVSKVIDSILGNPENQQIMAECDTKQEGTVNAVAMAYGDVSLCSLVMNITYNNYQITNHMDQQEKVRNLKKKVHRYKSNLKELIQTIDRSHGESSFNGTMKQFADSRRQLIESSGSSSGSDDDDNDSYYHHARSKKRLSTINNHHHHHKPILLSNKPMEDVNTSKKRPRPSAPHSSDRVEEVKKVSFEQTRKEAFYHRDKRVRLSDSDIMMDYSDEVELYIQGASDEEDLFGDASDDDEDDDCDGLSDILSEDEEEEEKEEEEEEIMRVEVKVKEVNEIKIDDASILDEQLCQGRCRLVKPMSAFIRKRNDCKTGISVSSICNACRK